MIEEAGNYHLPDALWEQIVPLLPSPKPKKKAGRPRMDTRRAMTAIFYRLRTGCRWNALPRSLGAVSTVHGHFQEWRAAGVFIALQQAGLLQDDAHQGVEWD
jgi:transposase